MAFTEYETGLREQFGWIVESGWGTGGTMSSGEVIGKDVRVEMPWSQGYQESLTSGADNRTVQLEAGPKILPYTLSFVPVSWLFLKYIMSVVDGTDGSVKTHTFSIPNTITSFKLERAQRSATDNVLTVTGNAVKALTINFSASNSPGRDGFILAVLDMVAKDYSQGTSVTTLSAVTLAGFKFTGVILKIDGNEIAEVRSGELTLDAGIREDDFRYANDTLAETLGEPAPGTFRIRGRFNLNIKDKTIYTLWAARAAVSGTCSLVFRRDDSDDQMTFTFTNFFTLRGIPPTNIEGTNNLDVVWQAESLSAVARDAIGTY